MTGSLSRPATAGPLTYRADQSSGPPPLFTYTLLSLTGTAAVTPGTDRIAATVESASPVPLAAVTITGAVTRLAAAACWVWFSVPVAASSEPAMPTVSRIGAAVATVLRTPATAPRAASMPVAPADAASGRVSSRISGGASSGANITQPRVSSIATGRNNAAVLVEWLEASTPISGTEPPSAASPVSQRISGIVLVSTDASRSASAGRTRAARREASHAPASAIGSPAPAAAASGHKMRCVL